MSNNVVVYNMNKRFLLYVSMIGICNKEKIMKNNIAKIATVTALALIIGISLSTISIAQEGKCGGQMKDEGKCGAKKMMKKIFKRDKKAKKETTTKAKSTEGKCGEGMCGSGKEKK